MRLDGCKFGNDKPACKRCPIHYYKPEMREKIRSVMRWAGPRMMIYDPWQRLEICLIGSLKIYDTKVSVCTLVSHSLL